MLEVFLDEENYRFRFRVFEQTDPSRAEREAGTKACRMITLDEEFYVQRGSFIRPSDYPLPKLAREFIKFLKEKESDGD